MIQPEKDGVQVEASDDFQSREYGIDEANMGMAYEAFMQYSNPISSIVREVTSNAYDAHDEIKTLRDNISSYIEPYDAAECAIPLSPQGHRKYMRWVRTLIYASDWTDPGVEVEMSNIFPPDNQRWFRVTDRGIGLSPERVDTIFRKFFSSTKRKAINQIGFFGLGSKSPLGYTDMFEVTTVYGGIKYEYVVHKAESSPKVTLMSKEETSDGNGTTVRVPIENKSDWHSFRRAVERQLCYFDNVIYGSNLRDHVENDFTIYRGKHFLYRPDNPFDTLHLCLGKVYYPVDFNAMEWDEGYKSYRGNRNGLKVPISLYFPLEGQKEIPLKIMWNRENVEYSDRTKESMNEKLKLMKQELQDLYDSQFQGMSNAEDWVRGFMSKDRKAIPVGDVEIPITSELVDLTIPVLKKYDAYFDRMPSDPFYMLKSYRGVDEGYIDQGFSGLDLKGAYAGDMNYEVFLTSEDFGITKNKYIYDQLGHDYFYIIKLRNISSDLTDDDQLESITKRFKSLYMERKSDRDPDISDLKAMLKFEQELKDHFIEHFKGYDEVTVPDSFTQREKQITKSTTPKDDKSSTFPLKEASLPEYYNESIGWSRARWKYSKLERIGHRGCMVIYGFRENEDLLIQTTDLLSRFQRYKDYGSLNTDRSNVVKIAQSREDMFSQYPTFMHVDDFWESDHSIFRKIVTAHKVGEILPKEKIFRGWSSVRPEVKDTYDRLKSFVSKWRIDKGYNEDWIDGLLMTKYHLLDRSMVRSAEWCVGAVLKYPLLVYLTRSFPDITDLPQVGLREELTRYVEGKGPINPHLYYRLHKHKEDNQ